MSEELRFTTLAIVIPDITLSSLLPPKGFRKKSGLMRKKQIVSLISENIKAIMTLKLPPFVGEAPKFLPNEIRTNQVVILTLPEIIDNWLLSKKEN